MEGEPASRVWFIKRGTVVLTRARGEGEEGESVRAVRRAGSFLGLEALVRHSYLDTARVTSASATLCGAPRETIEEWLGAKDLPARMALEQVLRTLVEERPRAAGADGNAVTRVARWILDEAGANGGTATSIPRRYTAGLLGMVPETFSRALARLARQGAIVLTRQTLAVSDPDALRHAAGRNN